MSAILEVKKGVKNNKTKIISDGGIKYSGDLAKALSAGADAVQLYTGMVYKGPGIVKQIKRELISILKFS